MKMQKSFDAGHGITVDISMSGLWERVEGTEYRVIEYSYDKPSLLVSSGFLCEGLPAVQQLHINKDTGEILYEHEPQPYAFGDNYELICSEFSELQRLIEEMKRVCDKMPKTVHYSFEDVETFSSSPEKLGSAGINSYCPSITFKPPTPTGKMPKNPIRVHFASSENRGINSVSSFDLVYDGLGSLVKAEINFSCKGGTVVAEASGKKPLKLSKVEYLSRKGTTSYL